MSLAIMLIIGATCAIFGTFFFLKKYCTCTAQPIHKKPETLNPHNTIIVFDIHGVLFKHNYPHMLKAIISPRFMYALIPCLFRPKIIIESCKLMLKKAVPEAYIVGLSKRFTCLQSFSSIGIAIANLQIPNKPVWHVVHLLHQQGYELHILSNIGETIFKDLQSKHPEIFALFTAVKVASPAEEYRGKPNPVIFDAYLTAHNPTHKHVIFIDDKQKNIQMATHKGMTSLFFCCAEHLHTNFNLLGTL